MTLTTNSEVDKLKQRIEELEYELKCLKFENQGRAHILQKVFGLKPAEAKVLDLYLDGRVHSREWVVSAVLKPYSHVNTVSVHQNKIKKQIPQFRQLKSDRGIGNYLPKDAIDEINSIVRSACPDIEWMQKDSIK